MRKLFIIILAVFAGVLCGCSQKPDYASYISENRKDIFVYSDDFLQLTINCVSREHPYAYDGICGDMGDLIEIFARFEDNPAEVEISLGAFTGEMNYQAVENRFTVTYSAAAFKDTGVDVTLICDKKTQHIRALSVKDSSTITPEQAVLCAAEYGGELFESYCEGKNFKAEIYVRLIYDGGCYYYVGVCGRDKNITAYLVDGCSGKVIVTKQLQV